jgi:hypothetical protein
VDRVSDCMPNGKNYAGALAWVHRSLALRPLSSLSQSPNSRNTFYGNLRFVATKATNRALDSFKLLVKPDDSLHSQNNIN